jgi:hypothetical protein
LFLAEVLSEFSHHVVESEIMEAFGNTLHYEKPIIITFNYDDFIEQILEHSSGMNLTRPPLEAINSRHQKFFAGLDGHQSDTRPEELSDEERGYHRFNWMRSLGYNLKFDLVSWDFAGPEEFDEGKKVYSHPSNKLYNWYLLKLHGSLNWFRYLPIRAFPNLPDEAEPIFDDEKARQIILSRQGFWFNRPPQLDGWFIDPIIITPTLYKEKQLTESVFDRISLLWSMEKDALSKCKRLVVIGYSFPSTDFLTKKLFLESFSSNRLEELVVVNPDTSIVQKIKDLCHYQKPVLVCNDLSEYLMSRNNY